MPFVTGWMGENHFAAVPVALYGFDLFMCAVAYYILARSLVAVNGPNSPIATALGRDFKGKISVVIYIAAIAASFVYPPLSMALYVGVAIMWFVPDRRMEHVVRD